MTRVQKSTAVLLVLAVILAVLVAGPAAAQQARQQFDWVIAKRLTVNGNTAITGNTAVTGNATVSGSATVTGNLTTAAALDVGTLANLSPATAISVTNGLTLTLAGALQPLQSAGTVTATLPACTAGDLYVLQNTTATTINIADSGTAKLTAAAALGQYDTLTVIGDGTYCIELARANN